MKKKKKKLNKKKKMFNQYMQPGLQSGMMPQQGMMGQPMMGGMMPQPMMGGMMPQPMMGGMGGMMMPQPVYQQIAVGHGIDMKEFQLIVNAVTQAYMSRQMPLSQVAANYIKMNLGGDWFVFVSDVGIEDYDFSLTTVKGGDFMAFSLDNKKFQVCRLRGF